MRPGRLSSRLMALLVALLPRSLRDSYGDAMLDAFESARAERRSRQGVLAAVGFTLRSAADLLQINLGERRRARRMSLPAVLDLGGDARRAFRSLSRTPGFTIAAVLVLALGIGVNAALFTAVKALLLTPPPYPDPGHLVMVQMVERTRQAPEGRAFPWSYAEFEMFLRMENRLLEPVAGFSARTSNITWGEQSARVYYELVSPAYLTLLGARPVLGRLLTEADADAASPAAVVVLSHKSWMSRFGGDSAVVGRTIGTESGPLQVVGVAQRGFDGLTGIAEMWLPLSLARVLIGPFMVTQPQTHWFEAVGRLRPGVTLAQAGAQLDAAVQRIDEVYPRSDPTTPVGGTVRLLSDARTNRTARIAVLMLAGAALMVLLIACANVAGLVLARSVVRRREVAVQVALGARRARIIRALLLESLTLAFLGGAAGLIVAYFGVQLLRGVWPGRFTVSGSLRALDVQALSLDPAVVAFAAGLTVLTGLLFGMAPALQLSGAGPGEALRSGGRVTAARGWRGIDGRAGLIAIEVALALMLLAGAGLMTSSMARLIHVDRGFEADHLLTFRYGVPRNNPRVQSPMLLHDAFLDALATDSRVLSAALGCAVPLSGHCSITEVRRTDDNAAMPMGSRPRIGAQSVSERYFETLRVPLLAGRTFTARDNESSPLVVIINGTAARTLFGSGDPPGHTLSMGYSFRGEQDTYTIVGVVGDVLYDRPEKGAMAEAYVPLRQERSGGVAGFVRTAGDPQRVVPMLTEALRRLEPGAVIYNINTASELSARAMTDTRVVLWLLAFFAGSAMLLAAIGIWSVVAYDVSQRSHELGVRMALGARSREVVRLVLRRGFAAAAAGVLLGVPAALVANRLISALLFDVKPTSPLIHATAAALLTAVALLASWIPALRATRVDPMRAMRAE